MQRGDPDHSAALEEQERAWGVTDRDRVELPTATHTLTHTRTPTDTDTTNPRLPPSPPHSHSHSHTLPGQSGSPERDVELLPALKKAYLLPKDHALHIPPHVTLSRLEDQVEWLAADLREVSGRIHWTAVTLTPNLIRV